MRFDLGLPTINRPARPALNVYSNVPDHDEDSVFMCRNSSLSCGHLNLGVFYQCAGCQKKKCPRCWNICDPVTRSILSVQVAVDSAQDLDRQDFDNTCKRCCNSHDYCPMDCLARQEKFALLPKTDEDDIAVFEYEVVRACQGHCDCRVCRNFVPFTVPIDDERPMTEILPRCVALRGRQYHGCDKVSRRCPDEQMCRLCFSTMWESIAPLMFTNDGDPSQVHLQYTVLARASRFSWQQTTDVAPIRPHHYLHSLESGNSILEEAVLHVGRHWACHGNGPCNVVSTSLFFFEAIRRLDDDCCLQIVCVPRDSLQSIACDLSFGDSFNEKAAHDMALCCVRHKVPMTTVRGYGLRFKEVCLSRRRLRDTPGIIAIEISAESCKDLRAICSQADEHFHCDALQFFEAERLCREFAIDAIQRRLAGLEV